MLAQAHTRLASAKGGHKSRMPAITIGCDAFHSAFISQIKRKEERVHQKLHKEKGVGFDEGQCRSSMDRDESDSEVI